MPGKAAPPPRADYEVEPLPPVNVVFAHANLHIDRRLRSGIVVNNKKHRLSAVPFIMMYVIQNQCLRCHTYLRQEFFGRPGRLLGLKSNKDCSSSGP